MQSDLIAGLTVGLTVIPQGLAYAVVAGLPPQVSSFPEFRAPVGGSSTLSVTRSYGR